LKRFITIIAALVITSITTGQTDRFDSLVTAGIYQIYNIDFENARSTFSNLQKEYPAHPAGKFFDAMILWWHIMLDLENEEYDDEFIDKLDDVIDYCEDILDDDPDNVDAMFFMGGSLGFRGRLYSVRKSWLNAALDGKDAMPLVYKAYELDPSNKDIQLGFGIYNYYADVIPKKYPFLQPFMIFFPRGDKEKGLKQLEDVASNGKYAMVESRYFLLTLYYSFEENFTKALEYSKGLVDDFPNNPTFQKYYGRIFVKRGNYSKAAEIFKSIYNKSIKNIPGYNSKIRREASYYIANNFKIKNIPDSAVVYFEECEKLSRILDEDEESGFLINAVLYLGMLYDQLGQREKAIKYYEEVLDLNDRGDSHTLAERFLKAPYKKH